MFSLCCCCSYHHIIHPQSICNTAEAEVYLQCVESVSLRVYTLSTYTVIYSPRTHSRSREREYAVCTPRVYYMLREYTHAELHCVHILYLYRVRTLCIMDEQRAELEIQQYSCLRTAAAFELCVCTAVLVSFVFFLIFDLILLELL